MLSINLIKKMLSNYLKPAFGIHRVFKVECVTSLRTFLYKIISICYFYTTNGNENPSNIERGFVGF